MYQELALVATDKNCMAAVEILKWDMEENFIPFFLNFLYHTVSPKRKKQPKLQNNPI